MSKVKEVLNRNLFPSRVVENIKGKYLEQVDGENNSSLDVSNLQFLIYGHVAERLGSSLPTLRSRVRSLHAAPLASVFTICHGFTQPCEGIG